MNINNLARGHLARVGCLTASGGMMLVSFLFGVVGQGPLFIYLALGVSGACIAIFIIAASRYYALRRGLKKERIN